MLRIIPTIPTPISLSFFPNVNLNFDAPFAMGEDDDNNVDGDRNEDIDFDAIGDDDDNNVGGDWNEDMDFDAMGDDDDNIVDGNWNEDMDFDAPFALRGNNGDNNADFGLQFGSLPLVISSQDLESHFDSIHSKLMFYENWNALTLLELAT